MNFYTLINKWSYAVLAILVYAANVLIHSMLTQAFASANGYMGSAILLFLIYLLSIDFVIPLLTGKSTLEFAPGWKNAMGASLLENVIVYLGVMGFLIVTGDPAVSRSVVGTSFVSSFLILTVAHVFIPRLFYDLSDHDLEEPKPKGKRRVTLWGINYFPEPTGIGPQTTRLAETLVEQGYDVTIVTAFSYYPAWAKDKRDEGRIFRMDSIRGVTVRRCWLYVPRQPTFLKRVVQQISFVVSSTLQLMFMPPADFYIGVSPPFTIGPVLRLLAKVKNASYAIHLQDDEIGAAFETTRLPGAGHAMLRQLEKIGFMGAKALSTISPRMKKRLQENLERAGMRNDVIILSNKAHAAGQVDPDRVEHFRNAYPTRRLLVYTGNLGDKQVLDDLIPAVSAFEKSELMLVICGQGAQKKNLTRLVKENGADNIIFQGLLSDLDHEALLVAAHACLLSEMTHRGTWLSPGICFASKMLSYLKHSKPIMVYGHPESEVVDIVKEYDCGFYLKPEQSVESLLKEFIECEDLPRKGMNGHEYYDSFQRKYDPVTWIHLMEHHIAEKEKIEKQTTSIPGKIGKCTGAMVLRVISFPLAVLLYGVLAIPIKMRKPSRSKHIDECSKA
ncbi:MAG: glycosyltransferase [Puniceicoccaceae bacterium]